MASYSAYNSGHTSPSNIPYVPASSSAQQQSYPPAARYDPSRTSLGSDDDATVAPTKKNGDSVVDMRDLMRTPSPTPSEAEELRKTSVIDWKAMMNWKYWIRKEWAWYYVAVFIGLVLVILFTVFHDQIVTWLQPAANWMHRIRFGWLIPIAILFVISFPPLFGHEIVGILCGLVWGLWVGFAIVAAGTFLGEVGNFYAFKHCCSARGTKLERTKLTYACLAKVVREGGFKIALIARLSAIPGHFTTAVFSTCGMSIWTFMIAAVLSTPKQFMTVYLGVALEQSQKNGGNADNVVKDIVLGVTVVITFVAMWYIFSKMNKAKPAVIYERRKARQAKLMEAAYGSSAMLRSNPLDSFNPNASEAEIPLTAQGNTFGDVGHQQWDASGRAVGYASDPTLFVPVPRKAQSRPPATAPTHRPQPRADLESAYSMTEQPSYQPTEPGRQIPSPTGFPNPFPSPSDTRPPFRPTYNPSVPVTSATPPPIPPPPAPPVSSPPQSPFTAQYPPRTAPAYGNGSVSSTPTAAQFPVYNQAPRMAPATAPMQMGTAYAAPPFPPPTVGVQHVQNTGGYPSYPTAESVRSEAGSLPPSYSDLSFQ